MHYSIEKLIIGDSNIVGYFAAASTRWKSILASPDANSVSTLASRLGSEQSSFEHECGGRWIGQEIMVLVGIAQFYTTAEGFGDDEERAKLVYEALRASYCSIEVKGHADIVARSYYLVDG